MSSPEASGRRSRWARRTNDRRQAAYAVAITAWEPLYTHLLETGRLVRAALVNDGRIPADTPTGSAAARRAGERAEAVGLRTYGPRLPAFGLRDDECVLWTGTATFLESARTDGGWPGPESVGHERFWLDQLADSAPASAVGDVRVGAECPVAVTDRRVIALLRGRRRVWAYDRMTALWQVPGTARTMVRVADQRVVSGLLVGANDLAAFRLAVQLGLAVASGRLTDFAAHLELMTSAYARTRPLAPAPVGPEDAPGRTRLVLRALRIACFGPVGTSWRRRTVGFAVALGVAVLALALLSPGSLGRTFDRIAGSAGPEPGDGGDSAGSRGSVGSAGTPGSTGSDSAHRGTGDSGSTAPATRDAGTPGGFGDSTGAGDVGADPGGGVPGSDGSGGSGGAGSGGSAGSGAGDPRGSSAGRTPESRGSSADRTGTPGAPGTPGSTPPPARPASDRCGAPANPWGLTYCAGGGRPVTRPPSALCSYFRCVQGFWNGSGVLVECADGTVDQASEHPGTQPDARSTAQRPACAAHNGPRRLVLRGA